MACRYTYQGKTYEAWEFEDLLKAMPPGDAALFMPTVKPIPEAPFVGKTDAWLQLALKRVMGLAVDGGYDAVAFVNGQQSADRYDLSKQVDSISYLKAKDGTVSINAVKDGRNVFSRANMPMSEVEDTVGKEIAQKIEGGGGETNYNTGYTDLPGLDLKVGGTGMKAFYDKIVPAAVKDVLKKVGGGQTESVTITANDDGWSITPPDQNVYGKWMLKSSDYNSKGEVYETEQQAKDAMAQKMGALQQPGFTITDAMREKVAGGMPLFSARFTEAADQAGFDTSKVWYHGTTAKAFKSFKPGNGGVDELGTGIYFTGDPGVAGAWAGRPDQGGRIIPAYVRKGEIFDSSKPVDYLALARRIKDRNPVSDDERRAKQIRGTKSVTEWTPEEQRLINRADSELWRSWLQESDEDLANQIRRGSLNAWLDRAGYIGRKNDGSQIKDQVVIFRPENIRAPWSKFNPKKSSSADYLASARVDARGFETWSEGLPVIENDGDYGGGPAVFVAYHGTTHSNITEFMRTGSKEGFLGQGPYFTTSPDDASSNYAGIGPDLRIRIDLEAEKIVDSMEDDRDFGMEVLQEYIDDQEVEADLSDDTYEDVFNEHAGDAAEHRARKQLKGDSDGLVMKSFVKLANPLDTVNGELTYQTVEDENGDAVDETGTLVDWIVAAREVAGYRGLDREVESYIDALLSDGDGVSASKVLSAAVKHLNGAYDDSGESVSAGQIVSEIAEQLGYDGIIMDAGEYFGGRRAGPFGIRQKAMAGVTDGALHIVPFSPNQVKSATGNSGAFSRADNDIRRSARVTETPEFKHLSALLGSSGMTGLMQSLRNKTIVDGLKRNAQALSDLLESHPGLSEQGRLIDIPTSVVGHVVKVVDDEQIRRAVVATLPVDVVNLLSIKQLSADQVLSDKAMLENVLSIDGASDVSLAIDKAGAKSLLRSVAIQATELAGLADRLLKSGPAGLANAGDSVFRAHSGSVTETEAFSKWFGDSKVVDANGKPLVVYHGTKADIRRFDPSLAGTNTDSGGWGRGIYFTEDADYAAVYAGRAEGSNIIPAYVALKNPMVVDVGARSEVIRDLGLEYPGGNPSPEWSQRFADAVKARGHDGVLVTMGGKPAEIVAFRPEQIKSTIGNRGTFDPKNPDIRYSARANSAWGIPENTWFDDFVFKTQDKLIDLKRVTEAIRKSAGKITDDINAYMQEELFHGRAAKRVEDFGRQELEPLMKAIGDAGLTIADVEEYLHARHAPEANRVIAERNPDNPGLQDGGSGMKTADAQAYMAALPADIKRKLESVAAKVDKIIGETRQLYVSYGLEDQAVVDGWGTMFQHYIPLQREDKEGGMGIGQGFSVKGKETKGRTGSTRKVVDILANIALQRERLIVRGEKNRVAQALVGMAWANPNDDFWEVRSQAPTERVYDPKTNKVVERPDNMFKNQPNVLTAKVKDSQGNVTEQAIVFNPDNQRAMRLAAAMKNIDAGNLEGLLSVGAKITRYFAAINTQYNPVFGVVNLVRDVQGALINLGGTPLADQRAAIAADTMKALVGIYGDLRKTRAGGQATSSWAKLWEEFQGVGGKTGFRDMFRNSAERAEQLQSILTPDGWTDSKWGKIFTAGGTLKVPMVQAKRGADVLFDWLSDYNEAMENGVRLAAYKAALDKGMTQKQAASLAKNLTVNFNRKGQIGMQMGAVYAFFNAAMQGTARIGEALFDMDGGDIKTLRLNKLGKKVVYGGMMLGSLQALMLAAAGFDDEEPPPFVRERSLVIPTGGKTYISIPMPLGLHVIPGLGRHLTEFALSGGEKPVQRAIDIFGMFADSFNPIGNAGMSMQTIAPTVLDPMIALTENRDWAGRPIARTSMNPATPGHALYRDTSSTIGKLISEGINLATGGNEYVAGALSPTPDQIDYLIGQITGGVGREASKIDQTIRSTISGEEMPIYKVPLVGRFVGNAGGQAGEGAQFYSNVNKLNELETEFKGLIGDGKVAEAQKLMSGRPDAYLVAMANAAERQVQRLRKEKRKLVEAGADRERVRAVEVQITDAMARLNRAVEKAESAQKR